MVVYIYDSASDLLPSVIDTKAPIDRFCKDHDVTIFMISTPTVIYTLVGKRTGEMYRGNGFTPSALIVSVIEVQQDTIIPSVVSVWLWHGESYTCCSLYIIPI